MNRHAKASSAASTQRQATGLGRIVRGAFAGRGASSDADGSGAPSYRAKRSALALGAALLGLLLFAVASASAAKQVVDYFGATGSKGGEFSSPRDIAVNRTGAGPADQGDVYVADDNNNRIQRFDSEGNFISAWGSGVSTGTKNEIQTLTVEANGGTFTLSFDGETTAPLAYNATSSTIQTALRGLSSVGGTHLSVSGSGAPFSISFNNKFAATNVPQTTVDDTNLSGSAETGHPQQGYGAYEICTVAANCRAGTATGTADFNGNAKNGVLDNPQSVAVDNDTGNVYVSDRDNRRVNEYTGDGAFIRSFGFGVDADVGGEDYEVCPASNRCTTGIAGAEAGQIGATSTGGTLGIAVSQADGEAALGTVFLADSQNRRVNTYALDGASPSSFGSATEFGTVNPRKVAVDSRGILYASDSSNANEIDRYDTEDANGGGVGFLASIPSPPLLAGPASTATSGLAVDPDSDEGGADEDVLHVLRDPSSGNTVVQQYGPVNDPGLTAAPTALDDTHGAPAGFTTVQGLGLDEESGRLFLSATTNVSGIGNGHRVFVLDDTTPPVAAIDAGSGFAHGAYEATFTGTVNPNSVPTGYHFEYVEDAQYLIDGFASAAKVPAADDKSPGAAGTPQPAEAEAADLFPGTEYHVRLVATNTFDATTSHTSSETTFTTDVLAPTVATGGADAQETTATIYGYVKPNGQSTDYNFEYGTQGPCSANPCTSTSVGDAGAGIAPVLVEAPLGGLGEATTHYFRLVAENVTGSAVGPDLSFTTGPVATGGECGNEILRQLNNSTNLPDCRAYELVTLPNSGGRSPVAHSFANIPLGFPMDVVSVNGDSVMYQTVGGGISGFPGTGLNDRFTASRTADGWTTEYVGPTSQQSEQPLTGGISSDHGYFFFETGQDYANNPDQGSLVPFHNCFACPAGKYIRLADGSMEPIAKGSLAEAAGSGEGRLITPGADHIIFETSGNTTVPAPQLEPDAPPTGTAAVYDRSSGGPTKLVSLLPGEVTPAAGQGAVYVGASKDGKLVAFRIEGTLYVRVDNAVTYEVTAAPYTFGGVRGDHVFYGDATGSFSNPQVPADLFSFDTATQTTTQITDVGDARFVNVSDDGSRVYFVSESRIDDEGTSGQPNLYVWERAGDTTTFIATVSTTDVTGDVDPDAFFVQNMSRWIVAVGATQTEVFGGASVLNRATPDGSVLVFQSVAQLTPFDNAGTSQIYRYDATSRQLDCISCAGGGPATGFSRFQAVGENTSNPQPLPALAQAHNLSEDGKTVVFETDEALAPADTNGALDVYRWRQGEGLALITTGEASGDSYLYGVLPDASEIVVKTAQRLVPGDENVGTPSLYAARVGGGFEPPVEAVTEPCAGDACQGAPSGAPVTPGAASAELIGEGNPPALRDCASPAGGAKKLGNRAKRLRRQARKAGNAARAKQLRHKAAVLAKKAKKRSRSARRCRRANRRAAR